VLLCQPCGAILAALREIIMKLEKNIQETEHASEETGGHVGEEPEPEQEMDPA
ncbi:unnamed protein product, partial [Symbiodinium pilosum]